MVQHEEGERVLRVKGGLPLAAADPLDQDPQLTGATLAAVVENGVGEALHDLWGTGNRGFTTLLNVMLIISDGDFLENTGSVHVVKR